MSKLLIFSFFIPVCFLLGFLIGRISLINSTRRQIETENSAVSMALIMGGLLCAMMFAETDALLALLLFVSFLSLYLGFHWSAKRLYKCALPY